MATTNKPVKKAASKDVKVTEVKKVVKAKPVVKSAKVGTPKTKSAPAKEMKLNNIKPVKAAPKVKVEEVRVEERKELVKAVETQVQEIVNQSVPPKVMSVKELTAAINQPQQPAVPGVVQPEQESTARKSMTVKEMMSKIATSVTAPFKRK